ncbi:hypothetical protein KY289_029217 [Solanum tuberosum]|nr:hypothetical protein KY289_029217 [Solanum tuberosum]
MIALQFLITQQKKDPYASGNLVFIENSHPDEKTKLELATKFSMGKKQSQWVDTFPCIIGKVNTFDVISTGIGESKSGTWIIVDVYIDTIKEGSEQYKIEKCRRLPSGCIIQDVSNGYSKGDDIIANQNSMLIFQDNCTDAKGSLLVYAIVDSSKMNIVMKGGGGTILVWNSSQMEFR